MDSNSTEKKRKILLIEDDPDVRKILKDVFRPYTSEIEILEASDAGKAKDLLFSDFPGNRIEAIILDIMMPYGTAAEELDAATDLNFVDAGRRFLRLFRKKEEEIATSSGHTLVWVSVITARSGRKVMLEIKKLLAKRGRIYSKPFDDMGLENDLAIVLGLKSLVDQGLLPEKYSPPAT